MRPLAPFYFSIAALAYASVYIVRRTTVVLPEWVNSYLTDFLCMPLVLTLCLVGVRYIKRLPDFTLTNPMIFGMTVFYAVLFELILPLQNTAYTADWLDVLMYFFGAIFYRFFMQKSDSHTYNLISD